MPRSFRHPSGENALRENTRATEGEVKEESEEAKARRWMEAKEKEKGEEEGNEEERGGEGMRARGRKRGREQRGAAAPRPDGPRGRGGACCLAPRGEVTHAAA